MDKPTNNQGSPASRFPKPRTVPKGWDMVDLKSHPIQNSSIDVETRSHREPDPGTEGSSTTEPYKIISGNFESYFDPQRFTFGWDMDALYKMQR